jgi:hypothetical protein
MLIAGPSIRVALCIGLFAVRVFVVVTLASPTEPQHLHVCVRLKALQCWIQGTGTISFD